VCVKQASKTRSITVCWIVDYKDDSILGYVSQA